MGISAGDNTAAGGMAKAIFDKLDAELGAGLASLSPEAQTEVRNGWRKLAFAIAFGVVEHIKANMEIFGIQVGAQPGPGASQTGPTTGHVR